MPSQSVPRRRFSSYLDALIEDYQEMHQGEQERRLDAPPSPMEAIRMIHRARPVVMSSASNFTVLKRDRAHYNWDDPETYVRILGDQSVTIALTDDGLADSVRAFPNGDTTFVKPLEEKMGILDFLQRLVDPDEIEALYLQSQDGNIYRNPPHPDHSPELAKLQDIVLPEVEWMQSALGSSAEAVNLWIGNERSTTSFHHDPFENIYHVLSGTKTFTLVSPIEGLLFDQHFHPPSTLHRSPTGQLHPILDAAPSYPVPWVSSSHPPPRTHPITVQLNAGETLYMPSGWWHRVEQSAGSGGLAVAVNYWYPAEENSQIHAYERLARRVARSSGRKGVIPVPGDESEEADDLGGDIEDEADEKSANPGDRDEEDGVWGSDVDSGQEWEPSDWGR